MLDFSNNNAILLMCWLKCPWMLSLTSDALARIFSNKTLLFSKDAQTFPIELLDR